MANQHLVAYIRNGMAQGYRADVLRNYLVQQGYPLPEVDAALMAAYHGEQPSKSKFLVFVAIVLIVFIGGGFFVYTKVFKMDTPVTNNLGTVQHTASTPVLDDVETTPVKQAQQNTPKTTPKTEETPAQKPTVASTTSSQSFTTAPKVLGASVQEEEDLEQILKDIRSVNDCDALEQRDRCVLEYSWLKDHVNFCDSITTIALKDECYSRYALRHEDKAQCQSVGNKYSREICDILLRTATMLRDQGTRYTLDPIGAKITYNQQEAIANLQKNAQKPQQNKSTNSTA